MRTSVFSARVDSKDSKLVEDLARLEGDDRSTVLRKLMRLGIQAYRKEVAVRAYSQGKATLSRASELMGVSTWEFLAELGHQGIHLNYDATEFEKDLKTIGKLTSK